jgi:hypothetical protein
VSSDWLEANASSFSSSYGSLLGLQSNPVASRHTDGLSNHTASPFTVHCFSATSSSIYYSFVPLDSLYALAIDLAT